MRRKFVFSFVYDLKFCRNVNKKVLGFKRGIFQVLVGKNFYFRYKGESFLRKRKKIIFILLLLSIVIGFVNYD